MQEANTLSPYLEILPYALAAMVITLLLTPLIGVLARKLKLFSLPVSLRTRVSLHDMANHPEAKLRLGGLSIAIAFVLTSLFVLPDSSPMTAVLFGAIVLTVYGFLDDKHDLSAGSQLLWQFLVAIIVVIVGGVRITQLDLWNLSIDLTTWGQHAWEIFGQNITFVIPADIFTIIWILFIINAVNWVFGIDALGETLGIIANIAIMLIAVKTGKTELAVFPAIMAGATLGYFPYNFPPAKIMGGTIADVLHGYIIATLSILTEAKVSITFIILVVPIIDMLWVIAYRLRTHTDIKFLKRPFFSGHVHLHHRLMEAGFSDKHTLYIETIALMFSAMAGFYFDGFSGEFIALGLLAALTLLCFVIISIYINRGKATIRHNKSIVVSNASKYTDDDDDEPDGPSPEEKFAY